MLTIPKYVHERIAEELATLPSRVGKINLTLEINVGTGNIISSVKVKKYIEDEMRNA